MSDSKRADDAAGKVKAIEQSYAYRGWLTALLTQTLQAEATIKYRIAELEQDAQRLRVQLDQMTPAAESLRQTIHSVDEAIRRRGEEIRAAAAQAAPSQEVETERESSEQERPQAGEKTANAAGPGESKQQQRGRAGPAPRRK